MTTILEHSIKSTLPPKYAAKVLPVIQDLMAENQKLRKRLERIENLCALPPLIERRKMREKKYQLEQIS